jgi:signal transduction histidine kinase
MNLGRIIRDDRDRILESWYSEASRSTSARGLSRQELDSGALNLLDALTWPDDATGSAARRSLTERHCSTRLRQGYELADMVEEVQLLGRSIVSVAASAAEAGPSAEEMTELFGELGRMKTVVIETFMRHMLEDEQAEKRHLRLLESALRGGLRDDSSRELLLSELLALAREAMGAAAASLRVISERDERVESTVSEGFTSELCELLTSQAKALPAGRAAVLPVGPELQHTGLRSLLAIRLSSNASESCQPDDGCVVLLCVGFSAAKPLTDRAISRMELIGERLALHLENARLHSRLRETIRALEHEREERARFVALLAHDLLGPLSAAGLIVERLALGRSDTVGGPLAARARSTLDRASRMVRDLLDASRLQAGKPLAVHPRDCDLSALAEQVTSELAALHGPRFVLDLAPGLIGVWDPDELARAVFNLAANAVKYGTSGAPITIRSRRASEGVELSVHNWGPAIAPEDRAWLFDPFTRSRRFEASADGSIQDGNGAASGKRPSRTAQAASADAPSGWGLGLTLVRGCAEAHGGSVRVDSAPDRGTTFTLALPLDARLKAGPVDSTALPAASRVARSPPGPARGPNGRARA